jgi:hypothetical protein
MPTTTTITSNYAGKAAGDLFLQTFKSADTLEKGIVTLYPNINYEAWLRKLQTTNGRRAYSCGHVPAGSVTLSERLLKPKKFKDDFDICKEDFRATWNEESMGASAHNEQMNREILDAIIVNKLADNAETFDALLWTGDDTNTDEFDGYLTLWSGDATVIKPYIPVATPTNILDILETVTNAVPIALRGSTTLKISVSADVYQAYMHRLIKEGVGNGLGGNANTSLVYGVLSLNLVKGLPANTIVIADPKNLVFGTGAVADHNRIDVVDEDSIGLLTGKVRGTMVYNAGVQYAYGAEIVWASNSHPVPSV